MKKFILTLLVCMVSIGFTFAQAPAMFKYQAVVRDNSGNILPTQAVKFRINLLKGSLGGSSSYSEIHTTITNTFGIANLEIGNGSSQVGAIDTIQWGKADYFIKIELDPTGSSGYTDMGTSQLLSVPYAMYAENSNNALNDNDKSPTNELQSLSLTGSTLSISNGNSVNLPKIIAGSTSAGTTPNISSGSGFSVTWVSLGTYTVTFSTPFTSIPTVVAHGQKSVLNYESFVPSVLNISVSGMTIRTGNPGTTSTLTNDVGFSFIAIGN